jgi:formylglycine-generating enzyme required for sulfatase activity
LGIVRYRDPPQLASLKEDRPMLRQVWTVALLLAAALGSLTVATAQELTMDLGGGVKLEMALIPAGSFLMGDEKGRWNEKPAHKVTVTKPFQLGKYPVTQSQWEAVMGSNPSQSKGAKNPAESVSWHDCQIFLGKLNAKTGGQGGNFVLPTEAQWEYACRAGSATRYCFGDDAMQLGQCAWYDDNSAGMTHPVGEKKPNAWGLFDMHGNVLEWCQDWWDLAYYANSPANDPKGPATGSSRVYRGGSLLSPASFCRSASRDNYLPAMRINNLGLRVARVPAE